MHAAVFEQIQKRGEVKMALISANAPLPLQGTYNTRDLGGYPAGPGAVCAGRFLRSDQPAGLGEGDRCV